MLTGFFALMVGMVLLGTAILLVCERDTEHVPLHGEDW